jgi:arylsulfatase
MEAFAGFLSHADAQVGRVVDFIERLGELDDTVIVVLSDNGASSEGGPTGSLNDVRVWNGLPRTVEEAADRIDEIGGPRIHNNYPWGWTVAGNTPFRRWKRETHEGGVADPLIVHWPRGIASAARGGVRRQYVHAVDLAPTILELVGVDAPAEIDGVEQVPLAGVSFAYSLDDADAPERHTTQYYEMFGCRAIYHEGWKAVVYHAIQEDEPPLDAGGWELYDLRHDPTECNDLAAADAERLDALVELWWAEAERYQVLPLDNRPFSEFVLGRPPGIVDRTRYVYWPARAPVPEMQAAPTRNRRHTITAHVAVTSEDAAPSGVLAAQGSVLGGWSFHVHDGSLAYVHNLSGWREYRVSAPLPRLALGPHRLGFRFTPGDGGPARGELLVDGDVVGAGEIKRSAWSRYSLTGHGLTIGYSCATPPADNDYRGPFPFTGDLDRVEIELDGPTFLDPAIEAADVIAMQ